MFYSTAFWNTVAAVYRKMKNLNSKSFNLLDLKYNIRIRVIGLGWEDLSIHYSKNFKAFALEELVSYLKIILSKQRSPSIPTKPPVLFKA